MTHGIGKILVEKGYDMCKWELLEAMKHKISFKVMRLVIALCFQQKSTDNALIGYRRGFRKF